MVKEMQKRSTRQLAAVYEALLNDHSHPSADEIFMRVRKTLPRISLGTVYRNLQRLVEEGKIRMLFSGGRMTRFDPMVAEHDHFICWQCSRVIDVVVESDRQANLAPLVEQGFTIATQSLSIHGLCQQCSQRLVEKSRGKMDVEHQEQRLRGRGRPALRKEKKIKEYGS
jgi:Fur family ferric uptake transcriptional regulator